MIGNIRMAGVGRVEAKEEIRVSFDESSVDTIFTFWNIGEVESDVWGMVDRTGRSGLIFSGF